MVKGDDFFMMRGDTYVVIEKGVGETPLQALERFRSTRSDLTDVPLTYAGRLDPMASGKLLILIGEECKKKGDYNALDKEYEFEMLAGIQSDTGDILGLAEIGADATVEKVKEVAKNLRAAIVLPYPAYSSKTVNGIPLFEYAREGKLDTIKIPVANVAIHSLVFLDSRTVTAQELLQDITSKLETLKDAEGNDFRAPKILERWQDILSTNRSYTIPSFRAIVSSGTYIRSLVPHVAESAKGSALAYSIHRTKIGTYRNFFGIGFWSRILR